MEHTFIKDGYSVKLSLRKPHGDWLVTINNRIEPLVHLSEDLAKEYAITKINKMKERKIALLR